ncbi:hypothetical protein AB4X16_05590 [Edwardsiella tarda]|uniref:hypothetical protein n=1 Tax=Edwardsiella tarda TaxID=636 RepID=UPI0034DCCC65
MDRVFTLLSKIILVLIIIFLLIGIIDYAAIAIEYFKGERMELGSLADWFSGLCNAVMAGAAVYAAYNARDWLSSKTLEIKYNAANDTLKYIELTNESLKNIYVLIADYFNDNETIKDEKLITELENLVSNTSILSDNLNILNKHNVSFKIKEIEEIYVIFIRQEDRLLDMFESEYKKYNDFDKDTEFKIALDEYKTSNALYDKIKKLTLLDIFKFK